MAISEKCYELAISLFTTWVFIDSARRYSFVEKKDSALMAIVNARAAAYDSEKEGALTEGEREALNTDLMEISHRIGKKDFTYAEEKLDDLSGQLFMLSLQKVVACECPRR